MRLTRGVFSIQQTPLFYDICLDMGYLPCMLLGVPPDEDDREQEPYL